MADEAKAPPAYGMADFLEEIDTIIWEKMDVMAKAASKGNAPVAGLTRIRIDRLEGIKEYLLRIDAFQRTKAGAPAGDTVGLQSAAKPAESEGVFDFSTLKRPTPKEAVLEAMRSEVEEKSAEPEKLVHQEPEPLQDKAPRVEEPGLHDDDEW